LVTDCFIVENKSVQALAAIHEAQLLRKFRWAVRFGAMVARAEIADNGTGETLGAGGKPIWQS
jgi:hypothetical protein